VELALVIKELLRHKRALAAGMVMALAAAVISIYKVQLLPPHLTNRNLEYSAASTQVYVDSGQPLVGNINDYIGPNVELATVLANLMASPGGMERVGIYAHVPGDEIWAAGPVDPFEQRVQIEPTQSKRDVEIVGESYPFRTEFLADPNLPIISIYTQAPTTAEAIALANGSVKALKTYTTSLEVRQDLAPAATVVIRTLGTPTGGVVNAGEGKKLALLAFLVVFTGWCLLVLAGVRVRARWRELSMSVSLAHDDNLPMGSRSRNGDHPNGRWRLGHPGRR
jgi:hypothetical protein